MNGGVAAAVNMRWLRVLKVSGWGLHGAAIAAGVLLVGFKVFKWHLVEAVGPRSLKFAGALCWTVFAAALLWAAYHFAREARQGGLKSTGPAIVLAAAFAVAWLAPLSGFVREANFRVNFEAREQIVAMVQEGELVKKKLTGEVVLPHRFRHLSAGGRIDIALMPDRMTVFFYSHRGIFRSTGFAYVSDYVLGRYGYGGEGDIRVKLRDYWYYGEGEI